FSEAVQSDG
ncbi:hypothetical protein AALP_AAs53182U000100, partial [Arabis alpina]